MARQINITAANQQRFIITPPVNGVLLVQREYRLVGDDALLDEIPLRVIDINLQWADLPQGLRDALIAWDNFTGGKIDDKEGLT